MRIKNNLLKIKETNKKIKDKIIFFSFFFLYLIINVLINKLHITYKTVFLFEKTFFLTFVLLNVIIAFLFGIIINLLRYRIKESKEVRKKIGLAPAGIIVGILGGACPGCFAGLLPLIFSLIGVSFSLLSLPLNGLEILLLSIILMILSIYYFTKEPKSCKIKTNI